MKTRAGCLSLVVITCAFATASIARGQDTTTVPGVRLGLNYAAGTKPGVIVLPVRDDDDDSLRVIVQRDLDYSDRMNVIALDAETLSGLVPAPGEKINFELVAKFGAALLVRMTPTSQGMHVAAYDVAPWGNQTVISRVFRCGSAKCNGSGSSSNRHGYKSSSVTSGSADLVRDNGPQQVGLRGRRQLANVIEKQRASEGFDKLTGVALGRAGQRALLVSE